MEDIWFEALNLRVADILLQTVAPPETYIQEYELKDTDKKLNAEALKTVIGICDISGFLDHRVFRVYLSPHELNFCLSC